LKNLEAFIKNGSIEIVKVDSNQFVIDQDFLNYIKDIISTFNQENEGLSEKERYKKIISDYKTNLLLNRDK
jgi:hypothetical protein